MSELEIAEGRVSDATAAYLLADPDRADYAQFRVDGRSFPTGYPVLSEDAARGDVGLVLEHEKQVRRDLGISGGRWRGSVKRARVASRADRRVMVGPGAGDAAALGQEIVDGWCLARGACAQLGIASTDPLDTSPNVRYGVILDYLTRDRASFLAQLREDSPASETRARFGLDVVRISLEHGVTPDALAPYLSVLGGDL